MSTLGVWTFFLALAAFIFSFSSYVILCKCWEAIERVLSRLNTFVDDYNWDHFHGQEVSRMYDELVKRLRRDATAFVGFVGEDLRQAADAIENQQVIIRAKKPSWINLRTGFRWKTVSR